MLTFLSILKTHNWNEEVDIGHVVLSRSLPRTGEPGGCSYSELWGFWHKLHTEPFLFFLWHLLLLLCVLAGELHLYLLSQPSQKSQDSSFSSFSLISSSRQWPDPVSSVFNAVDIAPLFSTSTLCGWVEAIIISCLGPTGSPHLQSVVHIVSRVRFLKANLVLSLPLQSSQRDKWGWRGLTRNIKNLYLAGYEF